MQEQTNRRLFNKLFTEMHTVKKLKNPISKVNNIKLDKELQYLYCSKKDKIWFAFSETNRKYIYFYTHFETSMSSRTFCNYSTSITNICIRGIIAPVKFWGNNVKILNTPIKLLEKY